MSDSIKTVIRLVVIIVVSAFIGILFGQFVSNYELRYMLSREYCGEFGGIEIYRAGDVNEDNLAFHVSVLSKMPKQLTECCDRIYFTGRDLDLPVHESGLDSALGLTQGRTIYISTESFGSYVLPHELFHAYDNAHGEISTYSTEFQEMYQANKRFIPVYATYDELLGAEFFAQAGALYMTVPLELKYAAPEIYEYYNDTLGFGDNN